MKDNRDRQQYYKDNREKVLSQSQARYQRNKKQLLAHSKTRYYDEANYTKYIFWRAKRRARDKKLNFSIEISDIVIPKTCPILGIELKRSIGNGKKSLPNSPSLDRIVPELGYVKGNVRIISQQANVMKNSATKEQLITFAKAILKEYGV